MEHSTFVILETISVISVLIGLIAFVVAKTIENKNDLEDIYDKPASWWSAIAVTLFPLWVVLLALMMLIIIMLASCGFMDFIMSLRN